MKSIGGRGNDNFRWNGGRRVKKGYIYLYRPDHPHCDGRGYVLLHRLIMERILGRYLDPMEVVHHEDGNKENNHPSNLRLFADQGKHLEYHQGLKQEASAQLLELVTE
jgi:hypothetical protein